MTTPAASSGACLSRLVNFPRVRHPPVPLRARPAAVPMLPAAAEAKEGVRMGDGERPWREKGDPFVGSPFSLQTSLILPELSSAGGCVQCF